LFGNPQSGNGIQVRDATKGMPAPGPASYPHYNTWTVATGQSPQDIGGALDPEGMRDSVEEPLYFNVVPRKFESYQHRFLVEGDLVFVLRSKSQQTGTTTTLNLASMNILLRKGYEECENRLNHYRESDEYAAVEDVSERRLFGRNLYAKWCREFDDSHRGVDVGIRGVNIEDPKDEGLFEYGELSAELKNVTARMASIQKSDPNFKTLLAIRRSLETNASRAAEAAAVDKLSKKFWTEKKDMQEGGLRYLHLGSIRRWWNWLGIVKSSTNDADPFLGSETSGKSTVRIVVTVGKKVQQGIMNYWSNDICPGDELYLVLTRVKNPKDGSWGPFQLIPFSNGRNPPSKEDLEFEDFGGEQCQGCFWYIGHVSEAPVLNISTPQESRDIAAGLIPGVSDQDAHYQSKKLNRLVVMVRA
jgi:hypothetical protein